MHICLKWIIYTRWSNQSNSHEVIGINSYPYTLSKEGKIFLDPSCWPPSPISKNIHPNFQLYDFEMFSLLIFSEYPDRSGIYCFWLIFLATQSIAIGVVHWNCAKCISLGGKFFSRHLSSNINLLITHLLLFDWKKNNSRDIICTLKNDLSKWKNCKGILESEVIGIYREKIFLWESSRNGDNVAGTWLCDKLYTAAG